MNKEDIARTRERQQAAVRDFFASARAGAESKPSSAACAGALRICLYFDGGSRGNPGLAGAGWVITESPLIDPDCVSLVTAGWRFVGKNETNNTAEYTALVEGMRAVLAAYPTRLPIGSVLHVFGDSELIVNQIKGIYQVRKPHLAVHHKLATQYIAQCKVVSLHVKIDHIYRDNNKVADALANVAMDKQVSGSLDRKVLRGVPFNAHAIRSIAGF